MAGSLVVDWAPQYGASGEVVVKNRFPAVPWQAEQSSASEALMRRGSLSAPRNSPGIRFQPGH